MRGVLWGVVLVLLGALTYGCGKKQSADVVALEADRQREYCLNNPCPGDNEPSYNWATEAVFKRNGRWFVGPREFGVTFGAFRFDWSSGNSQQRPASGDSDPNLDNGREQAGGLIEFFVQTGQPKGEMYPFVLEGERKRDNIEKMETIEHGLELITLRSDPGGQTLLYLSQNVHTPADVPGLLSCSPPERPNAFCTTGFDWKGLPVYVRFAQHHAKEWPEILGEIVRILSLIREIKS